MEKDEFFALEFGEKLQFICMVRDQFSQTRNSRRREETIPQWLMEKAENLDGKYQFEDMGALFPESIQLKENQEKDLEVSCLMDEIINDLLYLMIIEVKDIIGIPWARYPEEEYG